MSRVGRRGWIRALAAAAAGWAVGPARARAAAGPLATPTHHATRLWLAGPAGPAEPAAADPDARRLAARLELWANEARRVQRLRARYVLTRRSALLATPLVQAGTLLARAPDTIAWIDDSPSGATTLMTANALIVAPHADAGDTAPIMRPSTLSARWLAAHLQAVFLAGDPETLGESAELAAPRSPAQLELRPERGSPVRKFVRSVLIGMDPVGGAVVRITITEAQGDVVTIELSDHRRDLDADTMARLLAPAFALR